MPATIEVLARLEKHCSLFPSGPPISLKEEPCLDETMCFIIQDIKSVIQYFGELAHQTVKPLCHLAGLSFPSGISTRTGGTAEFGLQPFVREGLCMYPRSVARACSQSSFAALLYSKGEKEEELRPNRMTLAWPVNEGTTRLKVPNHQLPKNASIPNGQPSGCPAAAAAAQCRAMSDAFYGRRRFGY